MKQFIITSNDAGQRLDKFLKKLMPNAALSLIYKLNRKNNVKVNRKREDNEYKLEEGDNVQLYVKDEEYEILTVVKVPIPVIGTDTRDGLNPKDIVYEDGDLLIVNKNPGVIVHPGDFKTTELSLIAQVQDYLGAKLNSLTFKPSLDVMLKALQSNKIEKIYLAVCLGVPPETRGVIKKKLRRLEHAERENKIVIDEEGGQTAITHYQVLETGIQGKYSLIECRLETGRMHQIRVHMSSIGCPILGDNIYGDKQQSERTESDDNSSTQVVSVSYIRARKFPLPIPPNSKKIWRNWLGDNRIFI